MNSFVFCLWYKKENWYWDQSPEYFHYLFIWIVFLFSSFLFRRYWKLGFSFLYLLLYIIFSWEIMQMIYKLCTRCNLVRINSLCVLCVSLNSLIFIYYYLFVSFVIFFLVEFVVVDGSKFCILSLSDDYILNDIFSFLMIQITVKIIN